MILSSISELALFAPSFPPAMKGQGALSSQSSRLILNPGAWGHPVFLSNILYQKWGCRDREGSAWKKSQKDIFSKVVKSKQGVMGSQKGHFLQCSQKKGVMGSQKRYGSNSHEIAMRTKEQRTKNRFSGLSTEDWQSHAWRNRGLFPFFS